MNPKLVATLAICAFLQIASAQYQQPPYKSNQDNSGFLKLNDAFKNENPVIGILTMPGKPDFLQHIGASQYIFSMNEIFTTNASIDSVAIPYNIRDQDLYDLLDRINGVFFTGGGLDLYNETTDELHPYTITSMKILNYAMNQTDSGDYFPVLGICQGIELLHILVANNTKALGWSKYENKVINTKLENVSDRTESRLFRALSEEVFAAIQELDILYHLHHRGIPTSFYETFPVLEEVFNILSVNTFDGVEIVSTAEAWDYPIYMFQYHPEIVHENNATDIKMDKSKHSYAYASELGKFIREELLKNDHSFEHIDEINRIRVKNGFKGKLGYIWEFAETYGFDY